MRAAPVLVASFLALSPASRTAATDRAPCQGSLAGAVTGGFGCLVSLAPGDGGRLFLVITPRDAVAGVPTYQPGSFELPAPPRARTYTLESLGDGLASVAAEGGTLYAASKTSLNRRGEVTITLTDVTPDPRRAGAFEVHGTYRALLPPAGAGKKGEVVVEVRF